MRRLEYPGVLPADVDVLCEFGQGVPACVSLAQHGCMECGRFTCGAHAAPGIFQDVLCLACWEANGKPHWDAFWQQQWQHAVTEEREEGGR